VPCCGAQGQVERGRNGVAGGVENELCSISCCYLRCSRSLFSCLVSLVLSLCEVKQRAIRSERGGISSHFESGPGRFTTLAGNTAFSSGLVGLPVLMNDERKQGTTEGAELCASTHNPPSFAFCCSLQACSELHLHSPSIQPSGSWASRRSLGPWAGAV